MMKIVITGGIGSGKSYVCRILEKQGIRVYDCDAEAKRLMRTDAELQTGLKQLVGEEVYSADFEQSDCEWMESAILFDSGFDRRTHFDKVVCVLAPVDVRLQRIMQRDHISQEKAQQWIDAVMPQEELIARSDYEIVNDGERDVEAQVVHLLNLLNPSENR